MRSKFEAKKVKLKEELDQLESHITKLSSEVTRLEREIAKANTTTVLSQNKNIIIKAQNEIEQLKKEIHQVLFPKDSIADVAPVLNAPEEPEAPTPTATETSIPEAAKTTVHAASPNLKKVVVDEIKLAKQDKEEATREIEAEMALAVKSAAATATLQRAQMAAAAKNAKNNNDDGWDEENVAEETTTQTVESPQTLEQIAQEKEHKIEQRIKDKQKARKDEQQHEKEIAQREDVIDKKKAKAKNLQEKIEGLFSDLTIKAGSKDIYEEAIKSQNELISDLNKKKNVLIATKDTIVKKIDVELETQKQINASGNEPKTEQSTVSEVPTAPAAPDDLPAQSATVVPTSKKSSTKTPEVGNKRVPASLAEAYSQIQALNAQLAAEDDDDDDVLTNAATEASKGDPEATPANRNQEKLSELGIIPEAVAPHVLEKAKQEALQIKTSVLDAVGQARSATDIDTFLAETDTQIDSVLADIRKKAAEESQQSTDTALQKAKDAAQARAQETAEQEALVAAENAAQPEEATSEKTDEVVDISQQATAVAAKTEPAPERVRNIEMETEIRKRFKQDDEQRKGEIERRIERKRAHIKAQWAERKEAKVKAQEEKPVEQHSKEQEIRQQLLNEANIDNRLLRIGNEAIKFEIEARGAYTAGDAQAELEYAKSCGYVRILHETLVSHKNDFLKGKGDVETDLAAFINKCEQSLNSEEAMKLEAHTGMWSTIRDFIYSIAKTLRQIFSSNKSEAKTITHEEAIVGSTDSMKRIIEMKNSLIDLKKENLSKNADQDEHESLGP